MGSLQLVEIAIDSANGKKADIQRSDSYDAKNGYDTGESPTFQARYSGR
jgi:hypothetical protein